MKKTFLFVAALAAAMTMNANVVIDETFAQDEFPGTETGWTQTGTLTAGTGRTITDALTYSNAGGTYILSGEGNGLKSDYQEGDKYLAVKQINKQQNNIVYLSYLYKAEGNQTQSQAQTLGLSGSATSAALRVWVGKNTEGTGDPYRMGITRVSGTGSDVQWATTTYAVSDVHLVVVKYDFSTSTASFYVDPKLGDEEPVTPAAQDNSIGTAKTSLSYLCFYTTGKTKTNFTISGIRVSTTWAEAVEAKSDGPAPEPEAVDSVATDFKSDNWGELATKDPVTNKYPQVSGDYPSSVINGFELNSAVMADGSIKRDGESTVAYTNRVMIDKNGSFVTPLLKNVSTVELAFNTGSDSKALTLQYLDENDQWKDAEAITGMKALAEETYSLDVDAETKIRVLNGNGGTLYIWAITTHPYVSPIGTGIDQTTQIKATKRIVNGQMVIERNGELFNVTGARL